MIRNYRMRPRGMGDWWGDLQQAAGDILPPIAPGSTTPLNWYTAVQTIVAPGSLATAYIGRQTGLDTNVNDSPVFRNLVMPLANQVGEATGYGPVGTYLSATGNAQAGGLPVPGAYVANPWATQPASTSTSSTAPTTTTTTPTTPASSPTSTATPTTSSAYSPTGSAPAGVAASSPAGGSKLLMLAALAGGAYLVMKANK